MYDDSVIKALLDERNKLVEESRAALDAAEAAAKAENRSVTAEELAKVSRHDAEIDNLDARMVAMRKQNDLQKKGEEFRSDLDAILRPNGPDADVRKAEAEAFGEELRAFLKGERRSLDITPDATMGLHEARQEHRALVKGTGSAGGNTVPTTFYRQLLVHLIEMSAILQAGATVFTTDSGENIDFPKTTGLSSASQTAEAATIATSNPAFGKLTLGAYKYPVLCDASVELIEDTGLDNLLSFVAEQAGWAVGNAWGAKLVTGAGSTEPAGIVTGATVGVTGATSVAGAPTFDNLIDLYYSVIAPYRNRPSCAWLFRDSTAATLRKIKDGDNNYIWEPSTQLGTPDRLFGKPTYTDPNVAAIATSAKSVLFGDISRYYVRQVRGIRFERSDDFQFANDLVTFKTVIRGDGGVADATGALKVYQGAAT